MEGLGENVFVVVSVRENLGLLTAGRLAVFIVSVLLLLNMLFILMYVVWSPSPGWPQDERWRAMYDDLKLGEPLSDQYIHFMDRMLSGDFFMSVSYSRFTPISDFIYGDALVTIGHFAIVSLTAVVAGSAYAFFAVRWSNGKASKVMLGVAVVAAVTSTWLIFTLIWSVLHELGLIFSPEDQSIFVILGCIPTTCGASILVFEKAARSLSADTRSGRMERLFGALSSRSLTGVLPLLLSYTMVTVLIAEEMLRSEGIGAMAFGAILRYDFPLSVVCAFIIGVILLLTILLIDIVFIYASTGRAGMKHRDETPQADREGLFAGFTLRSLSRLWKAYRSDSVGMISLLGIVVMVIVSILAPLLATVDDPYAIDSYEPNSPSDDWFNPHPPSLTPSPYSGFTHPLGTDHIGRDLYSKLLYDSVGSISLAFTIMLIAIGVGMCTETARTILNHWRSPVTRSGGWVAWAVADVFLAVPIFIVAPLCTAANYSDALLLLLLVTCIWAPFAKAAATGLTIFSKSNAVGERDGYRVDARAVGRVVHIGKFCVLLFYLSMALALISSFTRSLFDFGWAESLESAYNFGAFYKGDWWMIAPPVVMIGLLSALMYSALDRLEKILLRW